MKRNYVPLGKTITRAQIAARNQRVDALCRELRPVAETVYRRALQAISGEGAEIMAEEAREILRALCPEEDYGLLDEEAARFKTELTAALRSGPAPSKGSDDSLIERRSADLARAVVGFWMEQGRTDLERFRATFDVLMNLRLEGISPQREAAGEYQLICSRFGIEGEDAWDLLDCLYAGAAAWLIDDAIPMSAAENEVHQSKDEPVREFERVLEEVNRAPAPALSEDVMVTAVNLVSEIEREFCLTPAELRPALSIARELEKVFILKALEATKGKEEKVLAACRLTTWTTNNALKVGLRLAAARYSVLENE